MSTSRLDDFIQVEACYKRQFCEAVMEEDHVVYTDPELPDMYNHNFTYIPSGIGEDRILAIIEKQLAQSNQQGHTFLRLEIEGNHTHLTKRFPEATLGLYDYYHTKTTNDVVSTIPSDIIVKEAIDEATLHDGIAIDILANQSGMGEEFATKRIKRKAMAYTDPQSPLSLFVIYHKDTVVGNCEYLPCKDIVKIEDFDIYEPYQRRGFGSAMLAHLIRHARQQDVSDVYLITEDEDTAKHMYEKCGFQQVGQKTELFFDWAK